MTACGWIQTFIGTKMEVHNCSYNMVQLQLVDESWLTVYVWQNNATTGGAAFINSGMNEHLTYSV